MRTEQVDDYSGRLSKELEALTFQDRNELYCRIADMERQMRLSGQERPVWRGPIAELDLLGRDVVVPTDHGERRGRVICFGVVPVDQTYERSVIIHVPSSGTQHEAAGSVTRIADSEDVQRMHDEVQMAQRLAALANSPSPVRDPVRAAAHARRRGRRDPQLVAEMLEMIRKHPAVQSCIEGNTNYKVTGLVPGRKIYLFKTQLRVDLSGFSFEHPGIRQISEDEARDMHLGKVRAQLTFDDRAEALLALEHALDNLLT